MTTTTHTARPSAAATDPWATRPEGPLTPAEAVLHARLDELTNALARRTRALERLDAQRADIDAQAMLISERAADLGVEITSIITALEDLSSRRRHLDALAAPLGPR